MAENLKLKIKDRVKQAKKPSIIGTVRDIRSEVTSTSGNTKDKNMIIGVLWDSGTYSYFAPQALEVVAEDK